jgi:short-subunit dehydrogenase
MNRTVMITGASSGIGAAVARALAPRFRLILVARRADRLAELVAGITAAGGQATAIVADLGTAEGLATAARAAAAGLDGLVNNAGTFALAPGEAIDAAHLDHLLAVNLRAPVLLTAACLPHLRAGATIVNLSSQVVDHAFASCAAYTAAKCAVEGWSRVLREELRPRRIRVTVIAPGATDTEIWPAEFAGADRSRMSAAADVAEAIRAAIELPPSASLDRIAITPPGGAL